MPNSPFCTAKLIHLSKEAKAPRPPSGTLMTLDSTMNNERLQHGGGGGAASYSLEAGQSSDRAEVYWSLAPDTGAISLRGDLTNELYFEYRLVDRAGVRADQLFRGQLNAAKDCVLVLARSGLDPETMPSYTVTLHLATLPGLVSPQGQEAVVRVEVLGRNDNPPVWQQEQGDRGGLIPPSVQLVSVEPGFEAGTSVAKLLATDRDSGELGRVSYSLSADTPAPARPYFSVAPDSGEVKMAQPLEEAD